MEWTFDQAHNVAAITTRQVMKMSYPILNVVHYQDDNSWAFTCGSTTKSEDVLLVGMGKIVDLDGTIMSISDLPAGWSAVRESVHSDWVRRKDNEK